MQACWCLSESSLSRVFDIPLYFVGTTLARQLFRTLIVHHQLKIEFESALFHQMASMQLLLQS